LKRGEISKVLKRLKDEKAMGIDRVLSKTWKYDREEIEK